MSEDMMPPSAGDRQWSRHESRSISVLSDLSFGPNSMHALLKTAADCSCCMFQRGWIEITTTTILVNNPVCAENSALRFWAIHGKTVAEAIDDKSRLRLL